MILIQSMFQIPTQLKELNLKLKTFLIIYLHLSKLAVVIITSMSLVHHKIRTFMATTKKEFLINKVRSNSRRGKNRSSHRLIPIGEVVNLHNPRDYLKRPRDNISFLLRRTQEPLLIDRVVRAREIRIKDIWLVNLVV